MVPSNALHTNLISSLAYRLGYLKDKFLCEVDSGVGNLEKRHVTL